MNLLKPATREDWLKLRRGYVSSTESAALFGASPYMTAFEMAVQKRDGGIDTVSGERPIWGGRLQEAIAQGIADDYGVSIESMGLAYAVDDESRMGSSFDYSIIGAENLHPDLSGTQLIDTFQRLGPGLMEVKNVDSLEYKRKWIDDEAPQHIEIQLQHQLEVLGLAWGCIAALIGGNRVGLLVRERDAKVGAIIRKKVKAFWTDYDAGKLPDPLMPDDAAVLIALYQYADPNKVYDGQSDPVLAGLALSYRESSAAEKAAKEQKDIAKAHMLQIIKDAEKALLPGLTISAAMRAPVDVKAHTRSGFRDFRITEKSITEKKGTAHV